VPTGSQGGPRSLPDPPNLRHLKAQARDLVKAGTAKSVADGQYQVARLYGFASWPTLKAHVDSLEEAGRLKQAIDTNDIGRVKSMMTRNPALHHAPLGYGKDGPLTWVAECRVPWEPPGQTRLAMAEWMIDNGSDVHQGGDGPLMRAALRSDRIPMMALLVSRGADVNAEWHGEFPIIFAPCESIDPGALTWLLARGADPNCANRDRRFPGTALDYVIETYARAPSRLRACIDALLDAGAVTRYNEPGVLELLRGRLHGLDAQLSSDPSLVTRTFRDLECGMSGGRRLTLRGATLLHVAAEYHEVEAARLLLDRGAQVDAPAEVDGSGVGGQPPIFHAVTHDGGMSVVQLLAERGANLSVRARVPGRYDQPGEVVECTPLGYARFCSETATPGRMVTFLKALGAAE
jgi:ankyrin repeat protein